jgi:hypothetical protein
VSVQAYADRTSITGRSNSTAVPVYSGVSAALSAGPATVDRKQAAPSRVTMETWKR